MKPTIPLLALLLMVPASGFAQAPPSPAAPGGARLQLDSLDRLADRAAEAVNITIDPDMLKLAGAFMKGQGDEAQVKQLLSELRGIYVRVFEFDEDQTFDAELEAIRKQLTGPRWTRFVDVDSKRDRESVEVYSWREGDASGGLAILVAEPRELTVVNIVGPIDLARLGALQGQLGIPRLPAVPAPGR